MSKMIRTFNAKSQHVSRDLSKKNDLTSPLSVCIRGFVLAGIIKIGPLEAIS